MRPFLLPRLVPSLALLIILPGALAAPGDNAAFVNQQIAAGHYHARTRVWRDPCGGRQEARTFWRDGRGTLRRFRKVELGGAARTEWNFWLDWAGRRNRVTQERWQAGQRLSRIQLDYDRAGNLVQASAQPAQSRAAILRALPPQQVQYVWASREAALSCE